MGELAILNVGDGDTKLSFDPTKPDEVANASRIVKDMIRRGFAIFIEVGRNEKGPLLQRAHDFDESTAEYIVVGTPEDGADHEQGTPEKPRKGRKAAGAKKPAPRRVAASSTKGVAVARVAGG
jgi:hypothetical protein